jgi:hypothetical protein
MMIKALLQNSKRDKLKIMCHKFAKLRWAVFPNQLSQATRGSKYAQ